MSEHRLLTPEEIAARGWFVGSDGRVYEKTQGLATMLTTKVPDKDSLDEVLEAVDETAWPPVEDLRGLYDQLFSKYEREVWVWVMRDRKDSQKFVYLIPTQTGTSGSVENKDADSMMEKWMPTHRFVGTIHSHPSGYGPNPSGTDIDTWTKPAFGGLHIILGREGKYTKNVGIRKTVWKYEPQDLGTGGREVVWHTQDDKSLEETLLTPKNNSPGFRYDRSERWWERHTDDGYDLFHEEIEGLKWPMDDEPAKEKAVQKWLVDPWVAPGEDLDEESALDLACLEVEEADGMWTDIGTSRKLAVVVWGGRVMVLPDNQMDEVHWDVEAVDSYVVLKVDADGEVTFA